MLEDTGITTTGKFGSLVALSVGYPLNVEKTTASLVFQHVCVSLVTDFGG